MVDLVTRGQKEVVKQRRISDETALVLAIFVGAPSGSTWGRQIVRDTGIRSGSLYPILQRLEERGLLNSRWEDLDAAVAEGRRPRRLYMLNPDNLERAKALIAEWRTSPRKPKVAARGRTATA
jgi:PadR family transcriptional regulator PadR